MSGGVDLLSHDRSFTFVAVTVCHKMTPESAPFTDTGFRVWAAAGRKNVLSLSLCAAHEDESEGWRRRRGDE